MTCARAAVLTAPAQTSRNRVLHRDIERRVGTEVEHVDRAGRKTGFRMTGFVDREIHIRDSVGKGINELGKQLSAVESIMEAALKRHGYL